MPQKHNAENPAHPVKLSSGSGDQYDKDFDNAENLVQVVKNQCDELHGLRHQSGRRRGLVSVLQSGRQYMPILDVFAQGTPSAVALCWAAARIILEVCEPFRML